MTQKKKTDIFSVANGFEIINKDKTNFVMSVNKQINEHKRFINEHEIPYEVKFCSCSERSNRLRVNI